MLRITIEHSSFKGFYPQKLNEMIHPNLVGKIFTFIFWHFVFSSAFSKCAPSPKQLYHQSITHKAKYETTFSKNGCGTHNTQNSDNSFKMWQCDQIHISSCFGLKFCTNVKNKYEKGIFWSLLIFEKKIIRFFKNWKSCCEIFSLVLLWYNFFKMFK